MRMKKITLLFFISAIAATTLAQVAAPVFSVKGGVYTKVEGLYFTSETPDAKILYNKTGGDPKINGSSLFGAMKETVLSSTTINAVAYITNAEGKRIYSDVVSEYYEISPVSLFRITEEVADTSYIMNCGDCIASPFLANQDNGKLNPVGISIINNEYIETHKFYGLKFTATDEGYTIQDAYGRYMYVNDGNEFHFTAGYPGDAALWSIVIDGHATITNIHSGKVIAYNTGNNSFGAYSETELSGNHTLPTLFMSIEYPTITITPAADTELSEFAKFTVTCESGLLYEETNQLYAYYNVGMDSKKREFDNIEEIDDNTIEFTLDEPIKDTNDYKVIFPAGVFTLNPDGLGKTNKEIVAKYRVNNTGILDIAYANPDNNATTKDLQYLYFEFNQDITVNATGAVITDKSGKQYPLTVSEKDTWGADCASYALCLKTEAPLAPGEYTFVMKKEYVSAKANESVKLSKDITYKFIVTEGLKVKNITPGDKEEVESVSEIVFEFNKPVMHDGFTELIVTDAGNNTYTFLKEATEETESTTIRFVAQTPLTDAGTYSFTIYGYNVYREDETGIDGMEYIKETTYTFTIKGATGIDDVKCEGVISKEIYDLTGRRINKIINAGIYIIDGRKVIIK